MVAKAFRREILVAITIQALTNQAPSIIAVDIIFISNELHATSCDCYLWTYVVNMFVYTMLPHGHSAKQFMLRKN